MAEEIPERFRWALAALASQPGGRWLEIGCGTGVAAALILQRLKPASLTAIDRSATAIGKTRARNADAVATGQLHLLTAALADADFGALRFDQAFAINVNAFWREPAPQLAALDAALKSSGWLHLIYQPPAAAQSQEIGRRCAEALAQRGYHAIEIAPQISATAHGVRISARRG